MTPMELIVSHLCTIQDKLGSLLPFFILGSPVPLGLIAKRKEEVRREPSAAKRAIERLLVHHGCSIARQITEVFGPYVAPLMLRLGTAEHRNRSIVGGRTCWMTSSSSSPSCRFQIVRHSASRNLGTRRVVERFARLLGGRP